MRGRSLLLIIVTCTLVAVAFISLYRRDGEASYKGRTLEQWLKASPSEEREAYQAISIITSNAAPLLVQWLFANTTPPFALINRMPTLVTQNPLLRPFFYKEHQKLRAACALRAFEIAGTNAASAVPALASMTTQARSLQVAMEAINALSLIGPAAVPSMRQVILNRDPMVRSSAIGALRRMGTNAHEAIPEVTAALLDSDRYVRQNATNTVQTLWPELLTNTPAK